MGTQLYQLYDGTIKLSGCQKMLWHRKPIREEDIQILKKEERSFPFAPATMNENSNNNSNSYTNSETKDDEMNAQLLVNHDEQHMMYHHLAIDMSPYCSPSSSTSASTTIDEKTKCSSDIYQQLEQDGFALIRGTGISPIHCQNALSCTKSFFQHANEKVRRSCLTKDRARRGYSPQNSENFASLLGVKGSNDDMVRKFRVGPCSINSVSVSVSGIGKGGGNGGDKCSSDGGDMSSSTSTSTVKTSSSVPSSLHQPNAWPTEETWGEENATKFQSYIETYYTEICQVANNIVNAICDGITKYNPKIVLSSSLIYDGTYIENKDEEDNEEQQEEQQQQRGTVENTSILTLLGYKKGARHQGRHSNPLIVAHTDVGVITVLLFDGGNCATLQRSQSSNTDNDGGDCRKKVNNHHSWVDIKLPTTLPQDPIFVVNIGDCLSNMCGNALPSTLHRVMPCKGGTLDRNCLALFMGLNHDEVLKLPNGECMTYEEWRRRRIARAQDVLIKHREKEV